VEGAFVSRAKKKKLIGRLVTHVEGEMATMRKAALDAAEGATHAEAKPENDKDTRAIEASYLAAGQAERFRQMETSLKMLLTLDVVELPKAAPIKATAVVTLEDDDGEQTTFLLLPSFGGVGLELEGKKVQVVTPPSPLGAALLGRSQGDVIELRGKAGKRELTIVDVW
jgi:transcription elongation GreA/GreB family factor